MATLEYWVSPSGNNANAGTLAAPWKTLRYATSTAIVAAVSSADTVIINCDPSLFNDAGLEDYIRLDAADWTGGRLVMRSAKPGVPWRVGANGTRLIWAVGACDVDLVLEDCYATMPRLLEWAGLTVSSSTGVRLTIRDGCVFTHSATTAEDALNFDSDSQLSSLYIEPGVIINGWASLGTSTNLRNCIIDGLIFNAGSCSGDSTAFSADVMSITNSEFYWPTLANQTCLFYSRLTSLTFSDNIVEMKSSNSSDSLTLYAPSAGVSSVALKCERNKITNTCPSQALMLGGGINAASSRATNDATLGSFASVYCADNEIVQLNEDGGCIRVMIGTTNAVVESNYMRRGVLGSGTNVHVCYLYGDGISFRNNYVMGQVLAFGPNQKIFGNVIVDSNNSLLLGGTQGGSNAVGGGNAYTIAGNILVCYGASADACLNDYAYNGAYPTNLGALVCDCQNNVYVPLSGADAVRLTASGTYANTPAAIQAIWASWGDASNADNDTYSAVASASTKMALTSLIGCARNVLLPADFAKIESIVMAATGDYAKESTVQAVLGML